MKQILALILTVLLLCTVLAPSVLAAEEPAVSSETTDTVTDSGSGSVSDDSIDTATPSDADMVTDGNETSGTDDSTARADGLFSCRYGTMNQSRPKGRGFPCTVQGDD